MRYRVRYFDNGESQTAVYTGDAEHIRARLSAEGKTVLAMQRLIALGGNKKRTQDVISVLQAMSDLLGVGVSLPDAVATVEESLEGTSELKAVLADIKRRLDVGEEFPNILDTHRDVFGNTVTQMVKSGYMTGNMAATMASSAKFVADMDRTTRETWKKLAYPLTVLTIGILLLLLDTQFLIPKLLESELFKTVVKDKEDATIKALEAVSFAFPLFFLGIVLLVVFVYIQNQKDPEVIERIIVRIPSLRELIFYRYFFIGFFSLANLIESGVRQATALEIVRDAVDANIVKREFTEALRLMNEGQPFAKGFKNITAIERTMLMTSADEKHIRRNMHAIADRFYRAYIARLSGISPKIYAITMIFVMFVFGLMATAVMVPYGKVLSGL